MPVRYLLKYNNNVFTSTILTFRMSEIFSNSRILPWQSMILRPYSAKKTMDWNFEHTVDDEAYEYSEEVLREHLGDKISELENQSKLTKKIMIKKSIVPRQKQPRMLTYCEMQHIRALHNSSPNEWTPETLSECFPALPYMINSILKMKWKPESVEKVKMLNKLTHENWEKLKRNELQASPEYLEHLKKFINKGEVLKLQLNNPNFSYLPPEKNLFEHTNGLFTSLIKDYEVKLNSAAKKMVESQLTNKSGEECLSLEDGNNASDLIVKDDTANDLSLKNIDNTNDLISKENIENDLSFKGENTAQIKKMIKKKVLIPEYEKSRGRYEQVTLDEFKQSIFKKAEKYPFLSDSDKQIIQKTFTRHHLPPIKTGEEVAVKSKEVESVKSGIPPESTEMKPGKKYEKIEKTPESIEMKPGKKYEKIEKTPESIEMKPRKKSENIVKTKNVSRGVMKLKEEYLSSEEENSYKSYPNLYLVSELDKIFNREESNRSSETEEQVQGSKKTGVPVNYYGTEKDEQVYKKLKNDISNTSFWTSEENNHSFYKNLQLKPDSDDCYSHHWKYSYPEKIEIPEGQVENEKLYKMNDCYYDHKGKFLFRVPGITQE